MQLIVDFHHAFVKVKHDSGSSTNNEFYPFDCQKTAVLAVLTENIFTFYGYLYLKDTFVTRLSEFIMVSVSTCS